MDNILYMILGFSFGVFFTMLVDNFTILKDKEKK
jgi:hypothetical protein